MGAILAVSRLPPSLRDRAASDQGPGHHTATCGVVSAQRSPMSLNVQSSTYRNLCCTWYASYVPARHFTDCEDGVANGSGPWRCTAGVTPASRRTEARTGPGPLCPRNGNDHPQSREHATTQRAGLLISPSHHMFSTASAWGSYPSGAYAFH